MKKMTLILMVMFCGLLFSGCGGGTPSSVVEKAVNAVIQADADELFKYLYDCPDHRKMYIRDYFERSEYSHSTHVYFIYRGVVNFKIESERIFDNGDKAEVIVNSFIKSGEGRTDAFQLVKTSNGWKINSRLENF